MIRRGRTKYSSRGMQVDVFRWMRGPGRDKITTATSCEAALRSQSVSCLAIISAVIQDE